MVKKSRIFKNYSLALQKRKSNNLSGTNLMFEVQISQNNENRRINRKFRSSKLNRFRYGGLVQMVEQLTRYTTRYQESDLHLAFILLNLLLYFCVLLFSYFSLLTSSSIEAVLIAKLDMFGLTDRKSFYCISYR